MSRPLRVDVPDGWYHVMSRGIDQRVIFKGDGDREHFLGVLEEMVGRYGVKVHAYVLMPNHYHLLVQTPHANLSRAMQWLNVSYGVWFNRRHPRVGPLFQGRFKSVPIDGEGAWALQASVYLHLNPVRTKGLGLGKAERKVEAAGMAVPPAPETVKARLETLRGHRWSSYLAYAGYRRERPKWLTCEELWRRAKRRNQSLQESYQWQVEEPLKAGMDEVEAFGERIRKAVAMGAEAFLERLRRGVRGDRQQQPEVRAWKRLLRFERVIASVVDAKGEAWEQFRDRRSDWGRDVALCLGWRHCGVTLPELGAAAGGLSAAATAKAVRRMEERLQHDRTLARLVRKIETTLSTVRT